MKQPKGLKLFDRDESDGVHLELTFCLDEYPGTAIIEVGASTGSYDAEQLDKLAGRLVEFSAYLRSLPKSQTKKPKWEDL